jgi:class 3 adenylate cyclase/pimeloyl-ACP methyl ester carboxylesterase
VNAPETLYTRTEEGLHIAYQVVGSGPIDIVYVPGWANPIDVMWEEHRYARFLSRLASFSRLIVFDKRGYGASDHVPQGALPTLQEWSDDIRTVMDAVGSQRAAILGVHVGGRMAALFAALYPERTMALILIDTPVRGLRLPIPGDDTAAAFETNWGRREVVNALAPEEGPAFANWWAKFCRLGAPPKLATALYMANRQGDITPILPTIRVPTLIVQRDEDPFVSVENGRDLATHIPGARYVEVPGRVFLPFLGDAHAVLREIETFLTGGHAPIDVDRVLRTVLFTDIVNSTARLAEMGDRRWRELLDAHDAAVRRAVDQFRGTVVKSTGDGFLVAFDGPARAIRCAAAIVDSARSLGMEVRAGLHTGECEVRGNDLAGIAVHIGARIGSLAGAGEVLATATVRDLVAGSGIVFADRGQHELKGVPGKWQVLAVQV